MSSEKPLKITVYEADGYIEYIVMSIGAIGKDTLAQMPSLSELSDRDGLKSILVCDDSAFRCNENHYAYPREMITNELQQADMLFCLVNFDIQDDYESACKIARFSKETNQRLTTICVYKGNPSSEHLAVLESLFTTTINPGQESQLLALWLFITKMEQCGFVGVEFADIDSALMDIPIANYYQFEMTSLDDLSVELSKLKDDLLRNGCSNFYNNTALGLFEVAPTVGFEEIDEVITALHTSNSNREGGLFNYIVWNMHWDEKLSDKSIRISLLYGKDANRGNPNDQD